MNNDLITEVLAVFGGVACIGGGVGYLIKLFRWIKQPNDTQNKTLSEHDEQLTKHSELLEKDHRRLNALEEENKLILRSLMALLSHGIDGNNTDEMKECKQNINKYLISK